MNKSHNYAAQLGDDMDDMELVTRYNLNPNVAYTPGINDAVRKAVYQENMSDLQEAGYSSDQARGIANRRLKEAEQVASRMK